MTQIRIYKHKDVEMLLAAKTIAESFKSNLLELSTLRTNWTPEYADGARNNLSSAA